MAQSGGQEAVFELLDGTAGGAPGEVLGLWRTTPGAPAPALAFDATSGAEDVPVWRIDLPVDRHQADRCLARAEASLAASGKALVGAERRIEALVQSRATPSALDPSQPEATPRPAEAEMLALLGEVPARKAPQSFGVVDTLTGGWDEVVGEFRVVLDRLQQFAAPGTFVETRIQGDLLARTFLGLTGGLGSVWVEGLGPDDAALHQRCVALALDSRGAMIRTVVVATQGVVKLSAVLALPGGPVLAIPVVWRFINRIRAGLAQHPING